MNILLVDDDETLRESLNLLLENEGYSISVAASGEEALEKADLEYFDLVLCDVRMPGIDGLETIERLKERVADAYFVVMTGYASDEAPIKALKLGVDDYLTKPFDIPLFLEKLRAVARRRRRTQKEASLGLGRLLASLRDFYPEFSSECEKVEEQSLGLAESLELSTEERETHLFGPWLHPLGSVLPESEADNSEAAAPTDRLAKLLREFAQPSSTELLAGVLRAAVSVAKGEPLVGELHEDVKSALKKQGVAPSTSEETQPTNRLVVRTLGQLEIKLSGQAVERKAWQSSNAKWLFVYLLTRGCQSVPEGRLAEQFWPGSPAKKAHRALVSSVHRARKALDDPELLVRYDKSYGIKRDCDYWLDSEEMVDAYKEGTLHFYRQNNELATTHLNRVLELYKGDFIPSCTDSWAVRIREDLRMKAVDAAEKLAQLELSVDPARSEQWCRKAISLEPTSEPAWATLFRALAGQGRRHEVETAFKDCSQTLKEELSLSPGARLMQSYEESLEVG